MKVDDLIRIIERLAPLKYAADWDKSGVQIACEKKDVFNVAVCLDPTPAAIFRAVSRKADFILTHHPLLLKPEFPSRVNDYFRVLSLVVKNDAWLYSAHTSLDVQADGPAAWFAKAIGLSCPEVLEKTASLELLRFEFMPAGRFSSEAISGMLCGNSAVRRVETLSSGRCAIIAEPAFVSDFTRMFTEIMLERNSLTITRTAEPVQNYGFGLIGDLAQEMTFPAFLETVREILPLTGFSLSGPAPEKVRRVAYCTGSGSSLAEAAFRAGADVYLTGDVKYHQARGFDELGMVIDVGHFILEEKMTFHFSEVLKKELQGQNVEIFFLDSQDPYKVSCPEN